MAEESNMAETKVRVKVVPNSLPCICFLSVPLFRFDKSFSCKISGLLSELTHGTPSPYCCVNIEIGNKDLEAAGKSYLHKTLYNKKVPHQRKI